jgi:hypothetical protein
MTGRPILTNGRGAAVLLLLALATMLLAAAGVLAWQQPDAPPATAAPEAPAALPHLLGQPRRFYVTAANHDGSQGLNVCAAGYHMASLWEMLDPTALDYASGVSGAKTRADQGSGPVAGWWGWARTGNDAYTANIAGRANCNLWTSVAPNDYGTVVRLAEVWTDSASAISPWQAQTWNCGGTAPVWCVSDPVFGVWLPVVRK